MSVPPEQMQLLAQYGLISPETLAMATPTPPPTPMPTPTPEPMAAMPPPVEAMPTPELPGPAPEEAPPVIDPALSAAMESVESGGNPNAVSPKGAMGTHQVMPDAMRDVLVSKGIMSMQTAKAISDEGLRKLVSEVPSLSKYFGEDYMRQMTDRFGGDRNKALAAYNGGPTRLDNRGQDISQMPDETRSYVAKVNERLPGESGMTAPQAMADAYKSQQQAELNNAIVQEDAMNKAAKERMNLAAQQKADMQAEISKQQREEEAIKVAKDARDKALVELTSGGIDPERLWNNRSTGSKVLSLIGIALGGFAAGMNGGKNSALEVLVREIDRDVDSQVNELEKRGKVVSAADKAYSDILAATGSQRAAREGLRSIKIDAAKQIAEAYSLQAQGAEKKNNALKAVGALQVEMQKSIDAMSEKARQQPDYVAAKAEDFVRGKPGGIDVLRLPKELQEVYVDGLGFAASKDDAQQIVKGRKAYEDIKQLLKDLKTLRVGDGSGKPSKVGSLTVPADGFGAEVYNQAANQVAQGIYGQLASKIRVAEEMGALDRGVLTVTEMMLPKDVLEFNRSNVPLLGGVFDDPALGKINYFSGYLDKQYNNNVRNRIRVKLPEFSKSITELPAMGAPVR